MNKIDWTAAFTYAAIGILVPLTLRLLGKVAPPSRKVPDKTEVTNSELQKYNLVSFFLFLVGAGVVGTLVWLLFQFLAQLQDSMHQDAIYFISVIRDAGGLFGVFGGIFGAGVITIFALQKIYGARADILAAASTRSFGGYDHKKAMKGFFIGLGTVLMLGFVSVFRFHVSVFEDRIENCNPLTCSVARYSDLEEFGIGQAVVAPNGKIVVAPNLYFRFKDREIWVSKLLQRDPSLEEIARFISEKSGRSVTRAELLPEK